MAFHMEIEIEASATHITLELLVFFLDLLGVTLQNSKDPFWFNQNPRCWLFSSCTEKQYGMLNLILLLVNLFTHIYIPRFRLHQFSSNWIVQKVPMLITCNNWRKIWKWNKNVVKSKKRCVCHVSVYAERVAVNINLCLQMR